MSVGFGLALALLIANSLAAILNMYRVFETNRQVARTYEVIAELERALSTMTDAETGQRGYLITGEEVFLEPYHTASKRMEKCLRGLEELTKDNESQKSRIATLKEKVEVEQKILSDSIALGRKKGIEASREIVTGRAGKRAMDEIRAVIEKMIEDEGVRLEGRRLESESSLWRGVVTLGLVSAILLGAVLGLGVLIARHLDLRARQEKVLGEERLRWETILWSVGDGVIVTDRNARVVFVNPEAARLSGWTREDAQGKTLTEIFRIENEKTRAIVENPVEKVLREGIVMGLANHTMLISRDGRERPIDDSAAPIRDGRGEVVGAVLVFRDVSGRKTAEDVLRESETRFRELADAMPQIVWTARADGYINYYNERWYEFTGLLMGGGGDASWEPVLHPDDVQRCKNIWYHAVENGEPYEIEYRFREYKTGEYRWHLGRALPVRSETGRILKWIGTCTNVDDQKQLAESLREADQRKNEFMAMLAHELRNPLSAINGALQLFQRSKTEENEAHAQEVIARQVRHLTRLIDDLLDVSRISRGKVEIRMEQVDLREVLAQAAETTRGLVEKKEHDLRVTLDAEPMPVKGDATRLEQIFVNLLTNAAKYTDPGGKIELFAEREGQNILVRVRDSGMGISTEMLARVFEPFTQAERTIDRAQGGLGIGLTLVKQLAELHGGSVNARSEGPGLGSEFHVSLPLDPTPPRQDVKREAVVRPAAKSGGRVLVVDDNRDTAKLTSMLLQIEGYDVKTAHDGREAIAAARLFNPEVVLLDIGLPGMNGYQVAAELRRDPAFEDTLIVAISGYGEEQAVERSRQAGFDDHLLKPVDIDELIQLLTENRFQNRVLK